MPFVALGFGMFDLSSIRWELQQRNDASLSDADYFWECAWVAELDHRFSDLERFAAASEWFAEQVQLCGSGVSNSPSC